MSSDNNVAANPALAGVTDRTFYIFNAVLSTIALLFLGWLLMVHRGGGESARLAFLPAVNAGLNGLAATLLLVGYVAIRNGKRRAHQYLMVSAFVASSLFLICYLIYHWAHGDTKYVGEYRGLYRSVLATHVPLSMTIVPLSLTSFYFAFKGSFTRHRKIAKITLPIWLYVSVTGVVIFFMLRR